MIEIQDKTTRTKTTLAQYIKTHANLGEDFKDGFDKLCLRLSEDRKLLNSQKAEVILNFLALSMTVNYAGLVEILEDYDRLTQ